MTFIGELGKLTNETTTENGDKAYTTTGAYVLDFFSRAGAMRSDIPAAVKLFAKAYGEEPVLALKALFYLRDVRGGQGERSLFRACLQWLDDNDENAIVRVVPLVSEYGRWDDLFSLRQRGFGAMVDVIAKQLKDDEAAMAKGEGVSLLAKWLPSENASSGLHSKQALALAALMEMKPSVYRKRVVALRKYIKLLEQKMSAKQWAEIDYSAVPSQAGRKYVKAFRRNDAERYEKYLEDVMNGKQTMNAGTAYAYEVYNLVGRDAKAADAMWKSLPDYTQGKNALVVADVSGSMTWTGHSPEPIEVSVSLALYFAERNQGAFNGYFMTFSDRPQLQKVVGKTLSDKMNCIATADWGGSTNLRAAFKAILKAAQDADASQDEMPSTLYIISDMQFNGCITIGKSTFEQSKSEFEAAGYKLPHVVFWNVNAHDQSPVTMHEGNVSLISGASQSAFKLAVEGKSPMETMLEVLNSDRYEAVEKALAL